MSRSDFHRDKKKHFRRNPWQGMGQERWYLTPAGLLKPSDLPEDWGLAEVRGKVIRKIVTPPKLARYDLDVMRNETSLLYGAMLDAGGTESFDAATLYSKGLHYMDKYDYKKAYDFFKLAYEKDNSFVEAKQKMDIYRPLATS